MKPRAISFRNLPASISIAVGLGFIGSVAYAIALLVASGEGYERYMGAERARIFDIGCQYAQTLLYSCGIFALARRHVGAPRVLCQVAGWLMFAGLMWPLVNMAVSIIPPRDFSGFFDLVGIVIGLFLLAATILLTIGSDAWRRVPLACAGLVVLHVTSYWMPVVGKALDHALGDSMAIQRFWIIAREALWGVSLLFVAAALAAGGRDQTPDARRAATGFQRAHRALIVRLIVAITMAMMGVGASRSPGFAKLLLVGGPAVIIATQLAFAIALVRIETARVEGMPRFRLAAAAAGLFWYSTLQFEQVAAILAQLWRSSGSIDSDILHHIEIFSVIGPIVAACALALVGSAIISFANHRANPELAASAQGRTIGYVGLSLAAIALPSLMETRSLEAVAIVMLLSAVASVVALVLLAGLLKKASEQIEAARSIPPARVVSDS